MFPGQGSQHRGMGEGLFDEYPDLVARCDAIVGTDMRQLCLQDPERRLSETRWAQPALFLVNALSARHALKENTPPSIVLGHSLGEYNALEFAGALEFDDAFTLVNERALLMGQARGGAMAAVVGEVDLDALLRDAAANALEIANLNTPSQVVLAGAKDVIDRLVAHCRTTRAARAVPLAVSAAFHSSHMEAAADRFAMVLNGVAFRDPDRVVISNVTGRPYPPGEIRRLLGRQMRSQVRWWDCLQYLRSQGVNHARQLGPGRTLMDFWLAATTAPAPGCDEDREPNRIAPSQSNGKRLTATLISAIDIYTPGRNFCKAHGVREPYVAGAMYRGIASPALVVRMGRAGLLGVLGTGGLGLPEIESGLTHISAALAPDIPYAVNLLATPEQPEEEQRRVELYLRHGVSMVEAAAYTQLTEPLLRFRYRGAHIDGGRAVAPHRVIAKVSRREVAALFLQPPSEQLLANLRAEGLLNADEVAAARRLPVAADICVEADSGGHTDAGVALALIPSMTRLRDQYASQNLDEVVRIGAAGGLGTPESIAAAFVLGAEFVVTGSVNQCTPEAGTSDAVKDLLAQIDVGDTTYAPAGDMFELGARVQVVRKATLFPARANYLYQVYRAHRSLDDLDGDTRKMVERYLGCSLGHAWDMARVRLEHANPKELARVTTQPRARMARTFKTYFARSMQSALVGDITQRADFQIHSGPAMGALNAYLRDSDLQNWRTRNVDVVADHLLSGARRVLGAHI
ncbi:PfaD family polyunsaturated fatty acid/polyketide biosynthesis protein [Mycobacterium stomatepiae]|nr:PfaD family polyunsaturated fatty acid/polyketide biosynthesis protein [Mycobacterium stomatepiae]MCV7163085.1 PfaD family polyunsaturated fatty acid/polyketide biosynthesis protein [Mycobacterium stomatepiae]